MGRDALPRRAGHVQAGEQRTALKREAVVEGQGPDIGCGQPAQDLLVGQITGHVYRLIHF
ncbi:MAG TPA: hypothetical protein VKV40_21860 [Ktedonobacteraceae bacterium]|nr:hypothetical protein [Ktedonobacteraceae bacterium]